MRILDEDQTLDLVLQGRSIARLGDGELRVCLGGNCASQRQDKSLAQEMKDILRGTSDLLVGIPRLDERSPKYANWLDYWKPKYRQLLDGKKTYASAFITRPDSAPWIDRPDYWQKARSLWISRSVCIVTGEPEGSRKMLDIGVRARSVERIEVARHSAYASIDEIEKKALQSSAELFILACGCAATCLAARLHRHGRWAVDLGHMGMFLGRNGR